MKINKNSWHFMLIALLDDVPEDKCNYILALICTLILLTVGIGGLIFVIIGLIVMMFMAPISFVAIPIAYLMYRLGNSKWLGRKWRILKRKYCSKIEFYED